MRKQQLTMFVSMVVLVVVGAAAAQAPSQLDRVNVVRGTDDIRVEMSSSGAVSPKVSTLDSPNRVVVDLPATVMAAGQSRITVGAAGVKDVRIGMDGQTPPTTRIVVDLDKACAYELTPGAAGKLVLTLHANAVAKANAAEAKTVAASSAVPAGKPMSPFSPRVIDSRSIPATKPDSAPSSKPSAGNSPTPTDFVFVEPTYQAKNEAKKDEAASEPTVRAQEAAERFSDKTAAELLPVSVHTAQAPSQAPATITPAVNLAAEQRSQVGQQPVAAGPKYTGEPISVNLKDVDLKDFFRLIHEISGLNVVLDPMIHGTLTIVLDDVPWDQALDIVLKNNDLSRQLDGNVLRIATVDTLRKEAENRRAQIDAEALAVDKVSITRFLSYAHAKDLLLPLKKFLSQRGDVVADERTNSLIVNDIPAVLPQIDRIIQQMDRKTQEVEIEARVVAATRSFARDIGVQLGLGWGNGTTALGGVGGVGSSPIIVGGQVQPLYPVLGTPATGTQVPLFSNLGATGPTSGLQFLNATNNMQIDVILTAAESRGLLKVLSRPRVVTQNNIQAVVKQGTQIPIVTQAQLGGPSTTTFVSAFLRLTVTPQITSEGTIFLNVDVENTLPDYSRATSSNGDNPALITQQATTQVLVTDGGTVVIGGVIQTQNSLSVSQVPLLGDIPYLGNLFKHRAITSSDTELIFFITPRIIQT